MNNSDSMTALQEWLDDPETQQKIRLCIDQAIDMIKADMSLQVPRTDEERRGAFAAWLNDYRRKIGPTIQVQFRQQFPGISQRLNNQNLVRDIVDELVWPKVEPTLRLYAVRGLASDWVRHNMGDAVLVGQPVFCASHWEVPLAVSVGGRDLGRVVLDPDGGVVPHRTSSRETLLKAAYDSKFHAVASGAGQ